MIVFALTIVSILLGRIIYVPTDLLQGITAVIFLHIGYLFAQTKLLERKLKPALLALGAMFILSLKLCSFNIAQVDYNIFYPLAVFASIICIICIYQFSDYIKHNRCGRILSNLGAMSLLIMCIHGLDGRFHWYTYIFNDFSSNQSLYMVCVITWRLTIGLGLAYVLRRARIIKSLFNLK